MCNSDEHATPGRAGRVGARRLARRFARDAGATLAIEFGILFPVLILIVLGALEFGRALESRNQMSHALSRAVRVVNLDAGQTTTAIADLMAAYLDDFDADDLTITAVSTTISGIDYMDISVTFPFDVIIPFSTVSGVTLNVDTRVPVLSPTQ